MNVAQEILGSLGEKLSAGATVRNVFGDPIQAGGRTIIPVARIGFAMGAGGGGLTTERSGGGGGGGGGAIPVGVVDVGPEGARFIRFSGSKRLAGALGMGMLAGFILSRIKSR